MCCCTGAQVWLDRKVFLDGKENVRDLSGGCSIASNKAQSEIANPEKSLTATIVSPFPREASRTFRYASLSSGLELIRKCLGQHEIATLQATTIEAESGLICLTTTLVHASGEWVSSVWPVCPFSETAAPHRLGTALTYARRYALVTLVGIAGEDDLDAPDVADASAPAISNLPSKLSASAASSKRHIFYPTILSQKDSADLRSDFTAELNGISEPEALASWAQRVLAVKRQLSTADAAKLEAAFATKLAQIDDTELNELGPEHADLATPSPSAGYSRDSIVSIPKPMRERDRHHLRFVAAQPCLVCGRTPTDAHHIKFAELQAMGRKVSDRFAVPLCRLHHRDLHRRGNERMWWQSLRIEPLPIAAMLWETTHAVASDAAKNSAKVDAPPSEREMGSFLSNRNDKTNPIVETETR